ncbi:MAG: NAD(P)H-dependent flavin oxidoreductase [Lachnospiraceae bacterium]
MKTQITEMLGIKYPILCGGMYGLSEAELVAAVGNAGGLAFLSSSHLGTKEALREQIRTTRSLTNKPFGVNLSLLSEAKTNRTHDYINVLVEEGISVVETAGNRPTEYVKRLKKENVHVIHKAVTAKHALVAQEAGVDAVTLAGYAAGGHPGMEEVGLFVNLPETVRSLAIPVIAAGGIGTGAGMAAAFIMGAQAITMGTAFMVTKESYLHKNIKQRIIQSKSTDTTVVFKSIRNAFRCLKNNETERILIMERANTPPEELMAYQRNYDARKAYLAGDADDTLIPAGQAIGLVNEELTCKELIDSIMEEYGSIFKQHCSL